MNLKIGGSNVGKIMYNGQEFGGATKLEPGTIFYISKRQERTIINLHLPSATKNWSNLNGIKIVLNDSDFHYDGSIDISGDDFKNLDTEKEYTIGVNKLTVSRSIVDGEYRLNISKEYTSNFVIKAI